MPVRETFIIIEAWKQSDFLCKGYILSALEDDLYNVYSAIKTSKICGMHLRRNIRQKMHA